MNAKTIYKVFEDAFTDYFVTFEKNPDMHIERWLSAGVDFSLSYGVKKDQELVAFMLHAPREDFVMNLATGVRRDLQGQGLTGLMYERALPELQAKGFLRTQLEVITKNEKAIRAYEKSGFQKKRILHSWKGTLPRLDEVPGFRYDVKAPVLTSEHAALTRYPYAFEQDKETVRRRSGMLELHELRTDKNLEAFAIWNPLRMNLVQLEAVETGALSQLLMKMKLAGEHFGMINVDERNQIVNNFFRDQGLENFLSQYEMGKDL